MTLFPVIMCGGAGTRLWPASRPSRPKQFMLLSGNRSLFQETAARVAPLCSEGQLVVVAGISHRELILEQLAAMGLSAQLILEPEARDSGAAMAAAAAWTAARCEGAINVFVASDHHIPDHAAFEEAVRQAAVSARAGRIVTLGIQPKEPSSAYGYIAPTGPGLSPVIAFVEKPDVVTATRYLEDGYLWNSGNFIVAAQVFLDELQRYAPAVVDAAVAALPQVPTQQEVLVLGDAFLAAPKISIDYAVMEKTDRASVLAVDFAWSDLGAWDAVAATGSGMVGAHLFEDAEGCLVRACDGVMVAAIGVKDIGIIVESDAVLVCDLSRSQDVKTIVERLRTVSPQHLDFPARPQEGLIDGAVRLSHWLRVRALPLWSTIGQRPDGAFAELLSLDARPIDADPRAHVQARQIQVMAKAGLRGWTGPWASAAERGLARIDARFAGSGDEIGSDTATLEDQALLLSAMAALHRAGLAGFEARAKSLRDDIFGDAPLPFAGLRGPGDRPGQSALHMHFLEASLAWEEAGVDPAWAEVSDGIVSLVLDRFVDAEQVFVRDFLQPDWTPAPDDEQRVEPGRQFAWASLLARHAQRREDPRGLDVAHRLHRVGCRGVDPLRQVVVDATALDGEPLSRRARLGSQIERMKASLVLAEAFEGGDRDRLLADAAHAQRTVWRYLTPDGLWRDQLLENDIFLEEPASATILSELLGAWTQLHETTRRLDLPGADRISID